MGRYQKAPDAVAQPAVKSIQSGFVSASAALGPSGTEDNRSLEVAISSVDPLKCVCDVVGGNGSNLAQAFAKTASVDTGLVTCRIINATTLRISAPSAMGATISARWRVVEYA